MGTAYLQVDDIFVGKPLGPGDHVGEENLLGLCKKYSTSLMTRSVCHFRMLTAALSRGRLARRTTRGAALYHWARRQSGNCVTSFSSSLVLLRGELLWLVPEAFEACRPPPHCAVLP